MVSAFKLIGYTLQMAGMVVMAFAFITLITGIQHTVSGVTAKISSESGVLGEKAAPAACDPSDDLCGVDLASDTAMQEVMSKRVYNFITYLSLGIGLMFLGLLLRAGEELGGFFSKLRNKDKTRVPVGRLRWSDF